MAAVHPLLHPLCRALVPDMRRATDAVLFAVAAPEVRERRDDFAGAYLVLPGKAKKPSKDAEDMELAQRLWDASESITGKILAKSEC